MEVAGVTALGVGAVESGALAGRDTHLVHPPGAPAEDTFLGNCINHPVDLGHDLFFRGLRAALDK